jgi:Na+/H+ antiporter NhaD/arsenite permease-like protein
MPTITPEKPKVSATITAPRDRLPVILWAAAVALTAAAACLHPQALPPAARATLGPFAILAAIIAGSVLADRAGIFRVLAGLLIRDWAPRGVAAASVLAFTAVLSGLANLDVAVVVAMPVALLAARRHRIRAGRLAVAVALTANAASFLLPTSNITSLLLLGRVPLPLLAYVRGSWLAWLLVMAVTIGALSRWLAPAGTGPASAAGARPSARAVLDLIPLFAAASAIRAILAAGITLPGGIAAQLTAGSALAAAANNLPAAAALRPAGMAGLWAAILATAIGPGLLLTGSVATLICRRIARDAGITLRAWQYTAAGSLLVPAQLTAAIIGLHLTGAMS